MKLLWLGVIVILCTNPGSSNEEFTDRVSVVRDCGPIFVNNFDLESRHGESGLCDIVKLLLFRQVEMRPFGHLTAECS